MQLQESHKEDRPSIVGEQQKQERPPADRKTTEEQQREEKLPTNVEMLTKLVQEKESQMAEEIHALKQ